MSALSLSGCAKASKPEIIVQEQSWVKPIYIHKNDRLTPGTARQILNHNEKWDDRQSTN